MKWTPLVPVMVLCVAGSLLPAAHAAKHMKDGAVYKDSAYIKADNSWFVGVGGGTSWIGLPNNTTVLNGSGATPPSNRDNFSIKSASADVAEVMIGYRWEDDKTYFPSYDLYLQYRHYLDTGIKGTVTQYTLPGYTNYNYNINYDADLFTLTGKADLVDVKGFRPYLSAGVGAIINHLNDYSETALIGVTPRTNPNYNGNTSTSLAATLGAGIDYILTENTWLTLGYEHVFQGSIKSGPGAGSWSGTALNIGKVKMDTVFLNISAKFPDAFRS